MKKTGSVYLISLALTSLVNCTGLKIKDTKVCAVAGVMSAGMDCAHTLTPDTSSMLLDQTIEFLEPREAIKNKKGQVVTPARGAAMCQSAADWNEMKTEMEEACKMLGDSCSLEIKEAIQSVTNNLDGLQAKVTKKAKKK